MLIAIPSKGRPTKCRSASLIQSASVFVPESEANDYRRCGVNNVIPVPDSIHGITCTRNWILNSTDDRWVVFIDDDYKNVGWCKLHYSYAEHRRLPEPVLIAEFVRLFELTEQLNLRIWGVATQSAPRSIYPYKPFLFRRYVTASCMGMLNIPGFRFDEGFPVKEDYELCLRCIRDFGGVLAAQYWYWENEHWTTEGGCKSYRTQQMERYCIRKLQELYPGMIHRITRGGAEYSIELDF